MVSRFVFKPFGFRLCSPSALSDLIFFLKLWSTFFFRQIRVPKKLAQKMPDKCSIKKQRRDVKYLPFVVCASSCRPNANLPSLTRGLLQGSKKGRGKVTPQEQL